VIVLTYYAFYKLLSPKRFAYLLDILFTLLLEFLLELV